MNNTATLIPSDQVIIAFKGNHITAADISRALFYANSRMLAMRLYVDKSFATAIPDYAARFYTLMKWEMEVGIRSSGHLDIPLHSNLVTCHVDLCNPFHQYIVPLQVIRCHSSTSQGCALNHDCTQIGGPATGSE